MVQWSAYSMTKWEVMVQIHIRAESCFQLIPQPTLLMISTLILYTVVEKMRWRGRWPVATNVHTSRETNAHKKTLSTHKCSFQKCFLHVYISCMSFQIQIVLVKCCTKQIFCARRLWKIRENIGGHPPSCAKKMSLVLYLSSLIRVSILSWSERAEGRTIFINMQ